MSVSSRQSDIVGIIGFGELGRQIRLFLEATGLRDFVLFDDTLVSIDIARPFSHYEQAELASSYYIGLGYKQLPMRLQVLNELKLKAYNLPEMIHETAYINTNASIGKSTYIYPLCNIDKGVIIEDGALLNNSVVVSHDCRIGTCSYISPGVILSGNVKIGECTFIGSGVSIANGVTIGKNVKVGVGTVITKDIPDDSCVIGNPMRIIPNLNLS